jgi:hypothetical protein
MAKGTGGELAGRRPYFIIDALNRDWDELVYRHRGDCTAGLVPIRR